MQTPNVLDKLVGGGMFKIRRDSLKEIAQRRQSPDLASASVNAKLPERPSLDGYKVEVLPLEIGRASCRERV